MHSGMHSGMDSGRCRRCGRPFTAGEVTGLGILRTRPTHRGGPVVEFACPECRTVIALVPFGHGRYALPGQPPPPPPSDAERVMPWRRPATAEGPTPSSARAAPPPPRPHAPPPPPPSVPPAPPPADRPKVPPPPAGDPPLTAMRAYDALGLPPTASTADVEKAFRARALLCHPDKVAHLDPEFIALAEKKFRVLQEARDLLLGVTDPTNDPRSPR